MEIAQPRLDSFDEIDAKIDELLQIGGTQILFQGGVHPKLKIEWYEDLVEHIRVPCGVEQAHDH